MVDNETARFQLAALLEADPTCIPAVDIAWIDVMEVHAKVNPYIGHGARLRIGLLYDKHVVREWQYADEVQAVK